MGEEEIVMVLDHSLDDHDDEGDEYSDNHELDNTIEDNDEVQTVYKENSWPAKPDEPKGFTFKGKNKMMAFAMIKTKTYFKKGIEKDIIGTKFKILDTRMLGGATQNIVEMYDNDERGIEIADFWRPNKNKVCTVLIKKPKEHDEKFVSILA